MRKRGKLKSALAPWANSIVIKQAVIFAFTFALFLGAFFFVYNRFRADSINTITETTLSRDENIFNDLCVSISNIVFQLQGCQQCPVPPNRFCYQLFVFFV